VDDDYNLNIFEIIAKTNEPTKELVKRGLLMLKHFQVDVEVIKCLLEWREKYEAMFPQVYFLPIKF
jgi:hypothetical protein